MKASLSAGQLAVALLSLSSTASAAWNSWPRWLPELDSLIVNRDDSSCRCTIGDPEMMIVFADHLLPRSVKPIYSAYPHTNT